MFEEHLPTSQLSSGRPSNTDLFQKEVTPPRLLPKINSYADMAEAHQSSECVPDMHQSGGTNTVDAAREHPSWACDLTSWVPPGLVPPGLAFDDDMSVISGGEEVSSTLPARSLDGCVHGQVLSDVTLLKNDACMQDDECAASAGSVPTYTNIVSPVAQPNFASFHEPQHHLGPDLPMGRLHADMSMEQASEASDRKQSLKRIPWEFSGRRCLSHQCPNPFPPVSHQAKKEHSLPVSSHGSLQQWGETDELRQKNARGARIRVDSDTLYK